MLAKKRKLVLKSGVTLDLPLLLPSFSSKTFQDERVGKIVEYMSSVITDEVLISAYDLYYKEIKKKISFPSVVFIDSGGYEASLEGDLSETGKRAHTPRRWEREFHQRVLVRWNYSPDTVLISFDSPRTKTNIQGQIIRAKRLFDAHPRGNSELLIKTSSLKEPYVNFDEVIRHVHDMAAFDIVGFTEKELGESTLQRMCNIAKMREAFNGTGLDIPIHVFGSLDTVSTPLYFLAGADIFDGLTWLRFAFDEGNTVYKHNYGAKRRGIRLEDFRVNGTVWNSNYYYMRELKDDMLKFLVAQDYSSFRWNGEFFKEAMTVFNAKRVE